MDTPEITFGHFWKQPDVSLWSGISVPDGRACNAPQLAISRICLGEAGKGGEGGQSSVRPPHSPFTSFAEVSP